MNASMPPTSEPTTPPMGEPRRHPHPLPARSASLSLRRASLSMQSASLRMPRASLGMRGASLSLRGASLSLRRASLRTRSASLGMRHLSLSAVARRVAGARVLIAPFCLVPILVVALLAAALPLVSIGPAFAQTPIGTAFTYQGNVDLSGSPLNATADFQFKLFGALSGGTQIGSTQSVNNVTVSNGVFTTALDFGTVAFNGDKRFLEIAVRTPAGGGSFTTLSPRQELTSTPYALKVRGVDGHSLDASDGTPADALFVGPNGDVGIGTTTPAAPLHVSDDEFAVMILQDPGPASTQAGYVGFWNNAGTETGWVGYGTPGSPHFSVVNARSGGHIQLLPGTGGGVGIGTTAPGVPLQVSSDLPVLVLQDSGPAATQSGYLGFWTNVGVETAWVGYGTPGSPDFSLVNSRSGGDIQLFPGAGGAVRVPVLEITGADLAEKFPSSDEVEPGMVVAIDPSNPGQICLARGAYTPYVAGVVSGANDFSVGAVLGNLPGHEDAPPIALSGRVYVQCDASSGPIAPGDFLTTSETPGHAMKATDPVRRQGAILGKAMTALGSGRGTVLVLVSLQ